MAGNTEDEHPDNPQHTQPEDPSAAMNAANEAEPITSNQAPDNMEVHHHSHASHGKKKWKSYVWEFLMLFLAVFCGFLAEYQLEHKIERDREKQFISSLLEDLSDDVTSLTTKIEFERIQVQRLDTLLDLLNNPDFAKQQGDQLYYCARVGPRSQPFANNNRTFDQLKYSGGFRLIRNAAASNRIMEYYSLFVPIRLLEDNYNHEFDNYKHVAAKILDPAVLRRQEDPNGDIILGNNNPLLLTYDGAQLKELAFHILQMNGSRRSKILMLENLKKNAEELSVYLGENYHVNE